MHYLLVEKDAISVPKVLSLKIPIKPYTGLIFDSSKLYECNVQRQSAYYTRYRHIYCIRLIPQYGVYPEVID